MTKLVCRPRFTSIRAFLLARDGAITVDWIALTAALVGMGIAAAFFIGASVPEIADQTSSYLANREIVP